MKQNILKPIIALGLASVLTVSCDSYLDIIPKGKDILTSVDQYANLFNNTVIHSYPTDTYSDVIDDMWISPNLMKTTNSHTTRIFTYADPTTYDRLSTSTYGTVTVYERSYERINKVCNIILDNINDAEGDAKLKTQTIAEARALRAYNYYVLVNVFGKQYDAQTAATDLCVPLFDHYNLEARPAQATVAQLYAFIEADIEAAIPDLSNKPENSLHFSKAAAYALKAKVHLMKKEFDEAKEAALESYNLNHFLYDYKRIATHTALQKINQNDENLYFATCGSTIATLDGLDLGTISPDLATLFGASYDNQVVDDTRFMQFFSYGTTRMGNAESDSELGRLDARFAPVWTNGLNGARFFCYNSAGLRTSDVYLILAECYARENKIGEMWKYLDEVRKSRIVGYTEHSENPANPTEAVKLVITERRKELLGGFNRWCDLRRLNTEDAFKQTLVRKAPANPNIPELEQKTFNLPADSWLWIYPLPLEEFPQYGDKLQYNVKY